MATTANGLPYPVGTDLVRDGDNAMQALAEALDRRGFGHRLEHRAVAVTPNAAGGWSFNFARAFASNPDVVITSTSARDTSFLPLVEIMAAGVSATGVSGRAIDVTKSTNTAVTETIFIAYIAVGPDPNV